MPSCVVKWCKNNTTSQKKCQGITFHRFPTGNEPWKDNWTRIIRNCRGQEDWSASKSSVVCSIHFDQNDLYTTSKGRRRLVTYATKIKLFMLMLCDLAVEHSLYVSGYKSISWHIQFIHLWSNMTSPRVEVSHSFLCLETSFFAPRWNSRCHSTSDTQVELAEHIPQKVDRLPGKGL
ncbi:hypothetical protein ABMA28_004205 [Loxostege sticticalis]|uniref:THAP-type domain-containing protein n=1 Tax=Loxostege sticticalis TaxID=481309 RepID=A0ABD0SX53_LOXSC